METQEKQDNLKTVLECLTRSIEMKHYWSSVSWAEEIIKLCEGLRK